MANNAERGIRRVLVGPDEFARCIMDPDTEEVLLVDPETGQVYAPFSRELAAVAIRIYDNRSRVAA